MKKAMQWLLMILLFLAGAFFCVDFFADLSVIDSSSHVKKQSQPYLMENLRLLEFNGEYLQRKIDSHHGLFYPDSRQLNLQTLEGEDYQPTSSKVNFRFAAQTAQMDAQQHFLQLVDQVRFYNDSWQLKSDQMTFNEKQQLISNQQKFNFHNSNFLLTGKSFTYQTSTKLLKIQRPNILLNIKDPLTFSAQKAQVSQKTGIISLLENVHGSQKFSGHLFRAQKVKMFRHPITHKIDRLEAYHQVTVMTDQQILNTHFLSVNQTSKMIKINGNIELNDLNFYLTCKTIEYNQFTGVGKITAKPHETIKILYVYADKDDFWKTRFIEIQTKYLVFNRQDHKMILQGENQVYDPLDHSFLTAKLIEIYLDKNQQITNVMATNNFQMKQPGRKASANFAIIHYPTQTIHLSGNAIVQEGKQATIKGESLEMFMDVSKGVVKGKKRAPVRIEIPLD